MTLVVNCDRRVYPRRVNSTTQQTRLVRNARAVLDVLRGRDRPLTAQELHTELRARGERTGLTTVYRYLHALAQIGQLHQFRADDHTAYLACDPTPHDHLICRTCGRIQQRHLDELDAYLAQIEHTGFHIAERRLELYGHCDRCTTH